MCSNSYQSCTDLTDLGRVELRKTSEVRENRKTWQTRETSKSREDRENVPLWGSGQSPSLFRSRSMDFHPQCGSAGTKALCALFESKAAQEPGPSSTNTSPVLNSADAPDGKRDRARPLQDRRGHSNLLKDMTNPVRCLGTFHWDNVWFIMSHLPRLWTSWITRYIFCS